MYDDVESDFWKDVFVHMQHKNMIRTDASFLHRSDTEKVFEDFSKKHPDVSPEIVNASSYTTWEIFITKTIKLRLFIQSQIKASLLQLNDGDFVKIADAKFPYNPFPEIEELLSNKENLENDLNEKLTGNTKFSKQQKITGEIIKALLMKKFADENIIWNLEFTKTDYKVIIEKDKKQQVIDISFKNFMKDIQSISL